MKKYKFLIYKVIKSRVASKNTAQQLRGQEKKIL